MHHPRVVDAISGSTGIEPAQVSKEPEGPRSTDPGLLASLPTLRIEARKVQPELRHADWEIFKIGELYYGRSLADAEFQFVTREIETPPQRVILIGYSAATIGKGRTFETASDARAAFEGLKYEVTGGKSKIIVPVPLEH